MASGKLTGGVDESVDDLDDGPTTLRPARRFRSWTRMPGLTLRSRTGALYATEPQWPRMNP